MNKGNNVFVNEAGVRTDLAKTKEQNENVVIVPACTISKGYEGKGGAHSLEDSAFAEESIELGLRPSLNLEERCEWVASIGT